MENAARLLEPDSLGILCRKPLMDEDLPGVSDVDLLSIWDKPEEYPERITVMGHSGRVYVDVLWIPAAAMLDPVTAAGYRMLPHLLMESEIVWMRSDATRTMVDQIRLTMYEKRVWERRLGSLLGFGDAALMEASRNLDFPPASLFYLQTASSYYLIALSDCLKQSIMSLLNRPIAKIRKMDALIGIGLEELLVASLHLDRDPSASLAAMRNLYDVVNARCSTRQVKGVSARTRGHYDYSISSDELEYRLMVANALLESGDPANANYYLRFWAYSLARCPVVLEEAGKGKNPSFYVPFRPLKESLLTACPEALDDVTLIMGGDVSKDEAGESVRGTTDLRKIIVSQIEKRGLHPAASRDGSFDTPG